MRSFSKKLAFVLAAAMVFTAFAPAAKAEAAAMKINKSSKILYVTDGKGINDAAQVGGGKGNVAEYDFSVSNKPKDYKKTHTFKWSSSDEDVIEVGKAGLTKAVGVGVADVVCEVTEKATGKVTTLKSEVTVKANAAKVVITNADDYADLAYEVGAEIDLNRAMYDANGTKAPKRGVKVTDYTRWMVEPSAGVKVTQSNGKYVFTDEAEAGTYRLWCETYQSSKYQKTTAKSQVIEVELVANLEINQKSITKFDINFGKAVAELSKDDVVVDELVLGTDGKTYKYDVLVKGVTLSKDKKTATVETFLPLKGDYAYEVTVDGYDTVTMVASDGDVEEVKVSVKDSVANQVTIGKRDVLQYSLLDGRDVDVTRGSVAEKNRVVFNIKYYGKNGTNYEMSYYANNAGLFEFNEEGDYAVITAEYNTGKFDAAKNEEIKITSAPTTFYAVAKQDVTVSKLTGFATNAAKGWCDYNSAEKNLVKLGTNAQLKFKIELADGKSIEITDQNQAITDKEGVSRGWIYVESVDEDVADLDENNAALSVSPRKTGTAVIMVYHKCLAADGYTVRTTPVAPITLEVKGAPVLTTIGLNYSKTNSATALLSINAAETDLRTTEVSIQPLDQYGKDYAGVTNASLTGNSTQAQDILNQGGVVFDSVNKKVIVNSAQFMNAIFAQNTSAGANADRISGKYVYTLKYQCTTSWAWKTATIIVDIRGLAKDAQGNVSNTVGIDCGWFNSNIARVNNDSDEAPKSATFKVFNKNNGANYSRVQLSKFSSDINVGTATPGYYFKVFKDNSDITYKVNGTDIVFNGRNEVKLNFSKTKTDASGRTVVDYSGMGAGNYQIVVYKIAPSIYAGSNATSVNVSTPVANLAKSVTCNAGAYTLVSRNSVNIAGGATNVAQILKCFSFKDRNGSSFDPYNTTDTAAKFGGNSVPYYVEIDPLLSTADSLYVKSVTFYEEVNYTSSNVTYDTGVYAAYNVPVGYYINTNVPQ